MLFTIYPAANIVLVAWLVASSVSITVTPYVLLLLGYVRNLALFFFLLFYALSFTILTYPFIIVTYGPILIFH